MPPLVAGQEQRSGRVGGSAERRPAVHVDVRPSEIGQLAQGICLPIEPEWHAEADSAEADLVQRDFPAEPSRKCFGEQMGAPWEATGWGGSNDWEFESAVTDSLEHLYELWDGAVERSRTRLGVALANGEMHQPVHLSAPDGSHASLRRLLCDFIEEYGRHTGHADLLREAVDGRVGEDPPAGWRAKSGRFRL